jgi:asparagine synthase (glutamine-hydrolysing)
MGGICGIVQDNQDGRMDPKLLSPMIAQMNKARQGSSSVDNWGTVCLGVCHAPTFLAGTADIRVHGETVGLGLYGNVYNLKELGVNDRTTDPFDCLLHLYLHDGMSLVSRLRGDFIIVVWDGREQTFCVATDRFRVHSLLYSQQGPHFVFASCLQALRACPLPLEWTINPEAIVDMTCNSVVPTPKSIFREVRKIPPGHVLRYQHGQVKLEQYWDMNYLTSDPSPQDELIEKLHAGFQDAIDCQLGDERRGNHIGSFLSGGIDSSTITGILAQNCSRPIKSFSIGFDVPGYNEINYARMAAKAFKAEHYEYFVSPQDTYDAIPLLLESFDEPFGNASAVPTYFCAKLAKEHGVDILFAGDGGDELFAGNERYATQRVFDYYQKIPFWCREHVVQPTVFSLANYLKVSLFLKGKKYIERANIPYPQRLSSWGLLEVIPMSDIFHDDLVKTLGEQYNPYEYVYDHYRRALANHELDRQLYVDLKVAIGDNDILKVTRMGQAAGVNVRFPFLDSRLAEFAATVPASLKMRGLKLRTFFKQAYVPLLPQAIQGKVKHGFGLPIPVWLRTDQRLNQMMRDAVLGQELTQRGFFQKKTLEYFVEQHQSDQTSFFGTVLWNIMMLELWMRRYSKP